MFSITGKRLRYRLTLSSETIEARIFALAKLATTSSTKKRYNSALSKFSFICLQGSAPTSQQELALALSCERLVALFIATQAEHRYSFETVRVDLMSLRSLAIGLGVHPVPPFSRYITRMLRGYKKWLPPPPKRPPVTTRLLLRAVGALFYPHLESSPRDVFAIGGICIATIFVAGFYLCLRPSEYHNLEAHCVRWDPTSTKVILNFRKQIANPLSTIGNIRDLFSKLHTLLHTASATITLSVSKCSCTPVHITVSRHVNAPICPVTYLALWCSMRPTNVWFFSTPTGNRVPASSLTRCLRLVGSTDNSRPPGHWATVSLQCLRAGGASAAAAAGASEEEIRALGRWSSDVVRIYVRGATRVRANRASAAIARAFGL